MRLTKTLCAQHLGWHFKKHWLVQGKRVPKETGAAAELLKRGVQVKNPEEPSWREGLPTLRME